MIGQVPSGARALVLTISDGVAAGSRQDESGIALADRLAIIGFRVDRRAIPDEREMIESTIRNGAADHALVVSTGGTGLTPRDVTPQATLSIVDYEVPGLAEAMRAAGRRQTPMADLSRGVVGVLGRSLVVNVPGSPKAALESLSALEPVLGHALETLAGPFDHDEAGAGAVMGLQVSKAVSPRSTIDQAAPSGPTPGTLPSADPFGALAAPAGPDRNDPWRDLPEPEVAEGNR